MSYTLPPGFSETSSDPEQGNEPLPSTIWTDFGITAWVDIIAADGSFNPAEVRPGGYLTPQEALLHMEDRGIIVFSRIVYDGAEGLWHIIVEY